MMCNSIPTCKVESHTCHTHISWNWCNQIHAIVNCNWIHHDASVNCAWFIINIPCISNLWKQNISFHLIQNADQLPNININLNKYCYQHSQVSQGTSSSQQAWAWLRMHASHNYDQHCNHMTCMSILTWLNSAPVLLHPLQVQFLRLHFPPADLSACCFGESCSRLLGKRREIAVPHIIPSSDGNLSESGLLFFWPWLDNTSPCWWLWVSMMQCCQASLRLSKTFLLPSAWPYHPLWPETQPCWLRFTNTKDLYYHCWVHSVFSTSTPLTFATNSNWEKTPLKNSCSS